MNTGYFINVFGDICLTKDNLHLFQHKDHHKFFNRVNEILDMGTLNLANLEAPLIRKYPKPITKTGPNLFVTDDVIDLLCNAGFNIFSLANNHILDYGGEALNDTIVELQSRNIDHVGAGKNSNEASRLLIKELGEMKLGILSFAEHEFNVAGINSAGANKFDIIESFDHIFQSRKECDYLIIIYHGGIEYFKYPSPLLGKVCRKMAESGADLILCQHSHCIGSIEHHLNSTIIYGQGNAVFGYKPGNSDWNQGLIVQLNITEKQTKISLVPISAQADGGVDLMDDTSAKKCLDGLYQRGSKIGDNNFINQEWIAFCEKSKSLYLPQLYGRGRIFNHLNRMLNNSLIDLLYTKRNKLITHNIIRCDSHREVIDTILNSSY